MKLRIGRALLTLAATGICMATLASAAQAQVEDWDFAARRLEGTWKVQITSHDCVTGAVLGSPFNSLLTFSRGGTMLETTSSPAFFPAVRGPGHGVWKHLGHRKFYATWTAFITMNGLLVRTQTIATSVEMGEDPDKFTNPNATTTFVAADGSATIHGCSTAVGVRFE